MYGGSLAERLGYDPDTRLLIVNCDDFGSSHAANLGVQDAMRRGFATSTTLMVPCPWAYEAARASKGLDVGVHLTLTAEYPGYRWRSLTGATSLHDADGFLPKAPGELFANARLDDVRAECRAQIEQALAWGVDVTHLDSHMGTVQTEPRYYGVYLDLAVEYGLPMRMASAAGERALGFPCRAPATERGVLFADNLMAPEWPDATRPFLQARLPRLRPGVTETWLHPVVDGPELRGYDLAAPDTRASDHANLIDPALAREVEASGATMISYRPLRDLQRASA